MFFLKKAWQRLVFQEFSKVYIHRPDYRGRCVLVWRDSCQRVFYLFIKNVIFFTLRRPADNFFYFGKFIGISCLDLLAVYA